MHHVSEEVLFYDGLAPEPVAVVTTAAGSLLFQNCHLTATLSSHPDATISDETE
jgi:hypothetical protein